MKRTQSVSRKDSIKKQNASPGMKRLTDYFPVLGNIQSTSPKNRDESDQSGSAGAQCTPQKVSTDYHPEKDQKDGMKMKIPTQTVSNAATTTAFFDLSTESEPLSSVSMDSSSVDSPFRLRDQNKTLAIRTSSSPISSEHAPSTPTGRYHVGALVDSISLPLGTKSRPMVEIPVLRSVRIAEGRVGTQSAKSDEISKIDSQCQAGIKSTQLESLDQESLFILQSNSEHQSLQRDSPISPTKKQPSSASSTLSLTSSKRKRIVDSDSEEPSSEKKVNDSSYEPMNPKTKAPRVTNDCDDSSLDSPINFDDDDLEDLMFFEFSKPAHQKKPTSTPGPAKYESDHELDAHSRRSTRARKEVSYKPPPLDPFKDEALFAGTGSSNRTSSLKNDITSELEKLEQSHYSVPKRFSLDALLVDRKRNEETERQRRELGDTFKKLAEEEDTDFLSLTSTAGSKNVFAALEQIKAEDSALYQAFGRFLKAGEAPVKLSRVKLCREPIDERIEPSKPFPKFKDSISKALRKTKDGLSQMEIIHAALSLSNWHLKSEHGEWLFDTVCFASDYRVVQKATSILLKSLSDKKNEWDVSLSSLASFFENACRCDPRILTQFYRDTQNNMGKVNVPMTGLADAFIANGKDEQSERSDESRQTALDAKQINLRSVVCIATEAFIRRHQQKGSAIFTSFLMKLCTDESAGRVRSSLVSAIARIMDRFGDSPEWNNEVMTSIISFTGTRSLELQYLLLRSSLWPQSSHHSRRFRTNLAHWFITYSSAIAVAEKSKPLSDETPLEQWLDEQGVIPSLEPIGLPSPQANPGPDTRPASLPISNFGANQPAVPASASETTVPPRLRRLHDLSHALKSHPMMRRCGDYQQLIRLVQILGIAIGDEVAIRFEPEAAAAISATLRSVYGSLNDGGSKRYTAILARHEMINLAALAQGISDNVKPIKVGGVFDDLAIVSPREENSSENGSSAV